MLPTSVMYYCYIGCPASGTSVPLSPLCIPPTIIHLLLRNLFMHLCQCFLCHFLAWEQLTAYVMLCYWWVYSRKVPMQDAFSAFYLIASYSLDFIRVSR